ncbi:inositol transporter [Raphidocelis subcapitata]|uniref:Inositol transporter n=1 Tax=Raphidocelis subcapitata TaxID=307507 RepID=A0A2V0NJR8_9CHLO|nr:inositol transporter [Raphidocelis subcapitata]|eukprot:GBF87486.1 inositol transporter [Raphidocelis subcapitata]
MLLRVAFLSSVAGFLYGYDLGLIGGAIGGLSKEFQIEHNTSLREGIVAGAKGGAFFGTFLGGALMLRYGRRRAIALLGGLFAIGPAIMATAGLGGGNGPGALIAGRVIIGLGIGASAIVVPSYLAELAPARIRGSIVAIYEVMLVFGMLTSLLMDALLAATAGPSAWRIMVGLPAVPGLVLAASLLFLPESPRWLVMRGDIDAARATLHRVQTRGARRRACASEAAAEAALARAEQELERLKSSVDKDRHAALARRAQLMRRGGGAPGEGGASEATAGAQAAAVVDMRAAAGSKQQSDPAAAAAAAAAEAALEQEGASDAHTVPLGGHEPGREPWFVQTLVWMLADIVAVARGPERRAFVLAVVLAFFDQANASTSVINYMSTLLSQGMGVKMSSALLLPATVAATKVVGVTIATSLVDRVGRRPLLFFGGATSAAALFAAAGAVAAHSPAGVVVCMCAFLLGYSIGWASNYWVVVSELFSMTAKSPGSSAATAILFATGAITDLVFLSIFEACGPWTFVIFGSIGALGAVFVFLCIPETKGRTLLEVQELMQSSARPWAEDCARLRACGCCRRPAAGAKCGSAGSGGGGDFELGRQH